MVSAFFRVVTNLFYLVPLRVKRFKTDEPNSQVLVAGATKARQFDKEVDVRYEAGWIGARRGTLILTDQKLVCGSWEIPLSTINSAVLLRVKALFSKALVLQVATIDGHHFQRVVREGMLTARISLDITTADFKAMLVPSGGRRQARSVVRVFRNLVDKGVEIRLLHSGVPSAPALRELREHLPAGLAIRRCPRLHAKTVIVDARSMYLGSANLTGAGLGAKADKNRNFEIGIWTQAPELIDPVLAHFNDLWEGRFCDSCGRLSVCPIPLETPDLG